MQSISLTTGGTTAHLKTDGTVSIEGSGDLEDLLQLCLMLKPSSRPTGGREWWPFLLIHEIHSTFGLQAAKAASTEVYPKNPTRQSNPRNIEFARWIKKENLYRCASVESVTMAKSEIWNADFNRPKTSPRARQVIKLLKKGVSWADIKKTIKTNTA
jgi:hypothetical protein